MRTRLSIMALLLPLALMAGCEGAEDNATVGGLSREEAAQLDNAADMLDASPDDLSLPPSSGNQAAPAP